MMWNVWSIPLEGDPVQLAAGVEHDDPITLLGAHRPHERTATLSVQLVTEPPPGAPPASAPSWRESNAGKRRRKKQAKV
jgi:hypothetical protein